MMRSPCVAACAVLAACAASPRSPATTTTAICPPDPPAGSGYVCAPPRVCSLDPDVLAVVNGPLGAALNPRFREGLQYSLLGAQYLFCPPPAAG